MLKLHIYYEDFEEFNLNFIGEFWVCFYNKHVLKLHIYYESFEEFNLNFIGEFWVCFYYVGKPLTSRI